MPQRPIILFNPQSSPSRKPVLPMALLALGASIEGAFEYEIVDGNLCDEPAREVAQRGQAPIVAVTVMGGPQLSHAVETSKAVKSRRPDATILWGGYFPTQHGDACLKEPYVDHVVRGHADLDFQKIIATLNEGHPPSSEKSTISVPDPDTLPDFPYHRVPVERYVRSTFMGRRTLPHHSSYGCPFTCNFCAVVNMVGGRWKAQSARRTAATVHRLVNDYRADAIEFYDNNFFVSEKRTAEFSDRVRGLGISWWGEARVDTLLKYDNATWQTMKESGLKMVFLGAESGSDETLRRMNKGGTASAGKTLEIAEKMRELGIVPEFSFVLGNPPDPEGDVADTISFIRRLKRVNPDAELVLYMYTPVPLAGDLLDGATRNGFKFPETIDEWISPAWQQFSARRGHRLPWVGDPVRRRVRNFERVVNAYHPTVTDTNIRGLKRRLLRLLGAWRYHTKFYHMPLELHAAHRLFGYQRPETAGF